MSNLLKVESLYVKDEKGYILKDINISLEEGETIAFIGESGSGKTMTLKAILSFLPEDTELASGKVYIEGKDIYSLKDKEKRRILGSSIGFVPQNTVNYLHPLLKIERQMIDGYIEINGRKSKREAIERAAELLRSVGIDDTDRVLASYPSELSGGMKQRVNIASALMMNPALLISDEPTSAIDRIVQRQVAELYMSLIKKHKQSLLIVSHDLALVDKIADRVVVFYSGRIVEEGKREEIFTAPHHPYTKALIKITPTLNLDKSKPLEEIKGYIKYEDRNREGCVFFSRCPYRREECSCFDEYKRISDTHFSRCLLEASL